METDETPEPNDDSELDPSLKELYCSKSCAFSKEKLLETIFEDPKHTRDGSEQLTSIKKYKRFIDFAEAPNAAKRWKRSQKARKLAVLRTGLTILREKTQKTQNSFNYAADEHASGSSGRKSARLAASSSQSFNSYSETSAIRNAASEQPAVASSVYYSAETASHNRVSVIVAEDTLPQNIFITSNSAFPGQQYSELLASSSHMMTIYNDPVNEYRDIYQSPLNAPCQSNYIENGLNIQMHNVFEHTGHSLSHDYYQNAPSTSSQGYFTIENLVQAVPNHVLGHEVETAADVNTDSSLCFTSHDSEKHASPEISNSTTEASRKTAVQSCLEKILQTVEAHPECKNQMSADSEFLHELQQLMSDSNSLKHFYTLEGKEILDCLNSILTHVQQVTSTHEQNSGAAVSLRAKKKPSKRCSGVRKKSKVQKLKQPQKTKNDVSACISDILTVLEVMDDLCFQSSESLCTSLNSCSSANSETNSSVNLFSPVSENTQCHSASSQDSTKSLQQTTYLPRKRSCSEKQMTSVKPVSSDDCDVFEVLQSMLEYVRKEEHK